MKGLERLEELKRLSLELGDPSRDLVILAEGNTSARIDGESFWVKASGTSLIQADHAGAYVAVRMAPLLATLRDTTEFDDAEAKRRLRGAARRGAPIDQREDGPVPSIETYCMRPAWRLGALRSSLTPIPPPSKPCCAASRPRRRTAECCSPTRRWYAGRRR